MDHAVARHTTHHIGSALEGHTCERPKDLLVWQPQPCKQPQGADVWVLSATLFNAAEHWTESGDYRF